MGSAPVDQGYIGAGAAHVEGDAVLNPGVPGNVNSRHDPGSRAGKAGVDRLPGGGFRADDSPVGLHNQQGGLNSQITQVAVQVFDVVADPRHDVGVEDGGYRPFVFTEDRQDFGGQRQVGLGEFVLKEFPNPDLVRGIGVGMGQGDGNGLDPLIAEARRRSAHRIFVKSVDDGAVEGGPFRYFEDALRWHRAFRLDPYVRVGQAGHAVASDFEDVLEPLGYQHPDGRSLALEDSVGGYGGAVEQAAHLRVGHAAFVQYPGYACYETPRWIIRGGGSLEQPEIAGRKVQKDYVGEGSPTSTARA